MSTIGSFTFVLHSHLPYVLSHGRWPHGTDWLNEAAAETYLPLLDVFGRLAAEGLPIKLTLGITPILAEQLSSLDFAREFNGYLKQRIEGCETDIAHFTRTKQTQMGRLAGMWLDFYRRTHLRFTEHYDEDIVGAFAKLQERGLIEIITSAATHGYLPLLGYDEAVRAQVRAGVETYKRHFGCAPRGIWLPECAYRPAYPWKPPVASQARLPMERERLGVEELLAENGIEYFITDSHMLVGGKAIGAYLDRFDALRNLWSQMDRSTKIEGKPQSPYGVYAVASREGQRDVCSVLVRDPRTGVQVWSGEHGYPGDGQYLEFHKKHFPSGNRYWRVTGSKADLADKQIYDPEQVEARLDENAGHFVELVHQVLREHHQATGEPGLLCAPFDTELFGHWWFEGPRWIEKVLRGLARSSEVELTSGSEYLDGHPPTTAVRLPEGSWGEGGFHYIWLNEWTDWTWKHIYSAESRMIELARDFARSDDADLRRVLRQAARELLLLESSDWQFLISTWSARDYAETRLVEHNADFTRLAALAQRLGEGGALDEGDWLFVGECETRDDVFRDVDPQWWVGGKAE
ncbi:MAG: DUF1957 domain-containing protein [Candidatus Alcyoniella australis]|nr:DUF1957 domain-containing protein [Candidatus Alcyoniella australis]